MTFPTASALISSARIDAAKSELKVGETFEIDAGMFAPYSLTYTLKEVDALPVYRLANENKSEFLTFDTYSIPKSIDLPIGISLKGSKDDFNYRRQSRILKEIGRETLNSDKRLKAFGGAGGPFFRSEGEDSSFLLLKDLEGEYDSSDYLSGKYSSYSGAGSGESIAIPHGTPTLSWNDLYELDFLDLSNDKTASRKNLGFGWILYLFGSSDILSFAKWDDLEGLENLVAVMSDKESLHVQQSLMDHSYFENKAKLTRKPKVQKPKSEYRWTADEVFTASLVLLAFAPAILWGIVFPSIDKTHAVADGKILAHTVGVTLSHYDNFGKSNGVIKFRQAKGSSEKNYYVSMSTTLGTGATGTLNAKTVPSSLSYISSSTKAEGITYANSTHWCITVSNGDGKAVYTDTGYKGIVKACPTVYKK